MLSMRLQYPCAKTESKFTYRRFTFDIMVTLLDVLQIHSQRDRYL